MTSNSAPVPIPGRSIDPPPKETPALVERLDNADGAAGVAVGVGYGALTRFSTARSSLLAAGTTYYVFLAMFSLIALAYGVTAMIDADGMAVYLTDALDEAFPGLVGDDGIDPAQMKAVGQTASVLGLVSMLYAGGGAMAAVNNSIHLIYGAPPDPRQFLKQRVRLLGWMLVIGPLIASSLVANTITLNFSERILDGIGWEGAGPRIGLTAANTVVVLGAGFLVAFIMLSRLGGIRPPTRALVIGSATGAVIIQILHVPMAFVVELSTDKPQYGALALPIGILLVLYLNCLAIYGSAALTAAVAERGVAPDPEDQGPSGSEPAVAVGG